MKTLADVVHEHSYPDYADWWPMGERFLAFMRNAIVPEWQTLSPHGPELDQVESYVQEYVDAVYNRRLEAGLAARFVAGDGLPSIRSGEFDALSYAFYRSAYEWMAAHPDALEGSLAAAQRAFAVRVGRRFYRQLHEHLSLDLPADLQTEGEFAQLQRALHRVGAFLIGEGYLRDHFAFRFDVHVDSADPPVDQADADFLPNLQRNGVAYALYEMGYPAILPSAVYLYHTMGEAQHHSSRTIQELFDRIGYEAWETDDFDPTGYPSDLVVELWVIRARG